MKRISLAILFIAILSAVPLVVSWTAEPVPIIGLIVPSDYLRQIEVDPRFRRRGVGKSLLDDAAVRSAKLGLSRVVLDVWAFNNAAQGLFDSVGFSAFGSKLVLDIKLNQDHG